MSQEERQMTPGDVFKNLGETFEGDEGKEIYPGQWHWHDAPYAPPFHVAPGAGYPQMYQIPWNYFPHFPYQSNYPHYYREEEAPEQTESEAVESSTTAVEPAEETRQLFPFFGISPFGPSIGLGFGGFPFGGFYPRPFYPRPFYGPYYGGYPYYGRPFFW